MYDENLRALLTAPDIDADAVRRYIREHPGCMDGWPDKQTPFREVMKLPYNEERMKPLIEHADRIAIRNALAHAAYNDKRRWVQFFVEHTDCLSMIDVNVVSTTILFKSMRVIKYFLKVCIGVFTSHHLYMAINKPTFPLVYGGVRHLLSTPQFADLPLVAFSHEHAGDEVDCKFLAAVVVRRKLPIDVARIDSVCISAFKLFVTRKNAPAALLSVCDDMSGERYIASRQFDKIRHCLIFSTARRNFARTTEDGETFLHLAAYKAHPAIVRRLYALCTKVCPQIFFLPNGEGHLPGYFEDGDPWPSDHYSPELFFAAKGTFNPKYVKLSTQSFLKLRQAATTIDDHAAIFNCASPQQQQELLVDRPSLAWRHPAVLEIYKPHWLMITIVAITQHGYLGISPLPPTMLATVYYAIDFKTV